jgi:hypothetical protein
MASQISETSQTIVGNINFLIRSPLYDTVKPYTLRYQPSDDFPQTNVERTLHEITFHDMRQQQGLSYEKDGFMLASMESCMKYEDYDDVEKVEKVHQKEIVEMARKSLGAMHVEVLDYVVRA